MVMTEENAGTARQDVVFLGVEQNQSFDKFLGSH
jgi:hypothetical protein